MSRPAWEARESPSENQSLQLPASPSCHALPRCSCFSPRRTERRLPAQGADGWTSASSCFPLPEQTWRSRIASQCQTEEGRGCAREPGPSSRPAVPQGEEEGPHPKGLALGAGCWQRQLQAAQPCSLCPWSWARCPALTWEGEGGGEETGKSLSPPKGVLEPKSPVEGVSDHAEMGPHSSPHCALCSAIGWGHPHRKRGLHFPMSCCMSPEGWGPLLPRSGPVPHPEPLFPLALSP